MQAERQALELLDKLLASKNPALAKTAAGLELSAGRAYGELGLWDEAAGHFRRSFEIDAMAGTMRDRFGHAVLLVLTGEEALYRSYCRAVSERVGPSKDWWLARMMVLRPGALSDPKAVVALAQEARVSQPKDDRAILHLALAQLRADQVDAALVTFQEFEKAAKGKMQFSWPALALARHKAGKIDEARAWLQKAERWYADTWGKNLLDAGSRLPKDGTWDDWAFFLILRREASETLTGKPAPADRWLTLHRGLVHAELGQPEKAEAEFQAAVAAYPEDPTVWQARSWAFTKLGRPAEAAADRTRALDLAERELTKRPYDGAAADVLAGFLQDKLEPRWAVVKPLNLKSEGGTTLTVQEDDSVLASGDSPDRDIYTLEAEVDGPVFAIKLEALPDPTLPGNGPGRHENGNFHLNDIRVNIMPAGTLVWSEAFADFEQDGLWARNAIDANPNSAWGIAPMFGKPHWAVFVAQRSGMGPGKVRISIRLDSGDKTWVRNTLGRFRLSVAREADMVQKAEWFKAATTPCAKVGAAYLALGEDRRAANFLTKATAANPQPVPTDTWLMLALLHCLRLTETDQVKKVSGKAAELLKPAGAAPALRPLLREVVLVLGTGSPEATELIAAAVGKSRSTLNGPMRSRRTPTWPKATATGACGTARAGTPWAKAADVTSTPKCLPARPDDPRRTAARSTADPTRGPDRAPSGTLSGDTGPVGIDRTEC